MKKLKNLNLRQLGQAELSKKEMSALTGGDECLCLCHCVCTAYSCGCKYAGSQQGPYDSYYGGSSTTSNNDANGNNARDDTKRTTHLPTGKSDLKLYPLPGY